MALLPQNPRDQKLMIVAVLAVGLAAVYQQLVYAPKKADLDVIAFHLDTLDSLNKVAKREVAQGNASKMKAEADVFAKELLIMRRLVPTENEVPALVDAVSTAARRAGLDVSDLTPEGTVPGDHFDTIRYRIGVTGPYHKVAEFLANVGSLQRIVAPINLNLGPAGRIPQGMKPRRDEQFLDAKLQIQTYVAHPAPPPKRAGAAGAAP